MNNCCDNKIKERTKEEEKELIIRLNKIEGQVKGIKKMIEDKRYCDDVLIQLSAVNKSIKSLANIILDNHMHTCVVKNIQEGNLKVLDEISDLFKRFQ